MIVEPPANAIIVGDMRGRRAFGFDAVDTVVVRAAAAGVGSTAQTGATLGRRGGTPTSAAPGRCARRGVVGTGRALDARAGPAALWIAGREARPADEVVAFSEPLSAAATAALDNTAAPSPNAMANPPTQPEYRELSIPAT